MKKFLQLLVIGDYYLAALLLVWAGVSKITSPGVGDLLESLLAQNIISLKQLVFISRWKPPLEIAFGFAALSGIQAAFLARVTGLIYLFYTLLLILVSEGYLLLPIDCGCFGGGSPTPVYLLILRNFFIALPLFFFPRNHGHFNRPHLLFSQN
ncbi:MAG: hypothetical protein KKC76_05020 [Proteobacteria bacterium]|nr:hypothetical protein [Pseudomonadota bacterium]MBU4297546.1 hypothetical protein [Pseudomonadota bacterium]MCG2746948.1 hypothetical protein [Desulfobulbaceae bacterium]